MNNPNLYNVASTLQRLDSEEIIKKFQTEIEGVCTGGDELVDIGCGDGFVTVNVIQKNVPKCIKSIVACDISGSMIAFAKSMYQKDDVSFTLMDITEEDVPFEYKDRFKIVTSFFCLHWVRDIGLALRNIYKLAQKDGACLLFYPFTHAIFDAYKILMLDPVWQDLMKDAHHFIPHLNHAADPEGELSQLMRSSGFKDVHVEILDKDYCYKWPDEFQNFVISVNPFLRRLPAKAAEKYLEQFLDLILASPKIKVKYDDKGQILTVNTDYKLAVTFARK